MQALQSRKWSTSTLEEGLACVSQLNLPMVPVASAPSTEEAADAASAKLQAGRYTCITYVGSTTYRCNK